MSERQATPIYKKGTFSANGETNPVFSWDYRNAVFTLIADDSAALTVKFVASNQDEAPDFSAAVSATNQYTTTQVISMDDHSSVDGDTGVVYAGITDGLARYEINENLNKWLGVIVSWYTAGDVTIDVQLSNNQ